jgi:S1-C subfamily serine protease
VRCVLVLLAASIGWTALSFAESSTPTSPPSQSKPVDEFEIAAQEEFASRERRCLATAIYYEARGRPVRGQVGLGQVIINRVRSPLYPETICGVVYEGQTEKHCQFFFACDGHSHVRKDDDDWALAQDIARQITAGELWLPELGYSTSPEAALAIGFPTPQSPSNPEPPKEEMVVVSGTGFIINDRGDVVTNNHVVGGCSRISFGLNGQGLVQGRLVTSDVTNDLAVANFPLPRTKVVASFSNRIKSRPGDDVVVFGYPLLGLLSSSGNLTRGSLTAMAGLQDDVRYMQISAPVQPGNSGGPVLNMGGEVIGIVTYKLSALETMKAQGDIPQNVNFALKASILRLFLDSHSIPYSVSDRSVNFIAAEVGNLTEQFTGMVVCQK